jgi:hypothetical protein
MELSIFISLQPLAEGLVRDTEKPGRLGYIPVGSLQRFIGKQLSRLFNGRQYLAAEHRHLQHLAGSLPGKVGLANLWRTVLTEQPRS